MGHTCLRWDVGHHQHLLNCFPCHFEHSWVLCKCTHSWDFAWIGNQVLDKCLLWWWFRPGTCITLWRYLAWHGRSSNHKINHHQEQWINISILNQQFQIFNVKIESDSILDGAFCWLLLQWLPVPKSLLPNPRKYGCKCFSTGISRIKDKTSS